MSEVRTMSGEEKEFSELQRLVDDAISHLDPAGDESIPCKAPRLIARRFSLALKFREISPP
jgi:hypothetical protein